jgi:hypothetical protein
VSEILYGGIVGSYSGIDQPTRTAIEDLEEAILAHQHAIQNLPPSVHRLKTFGVCIDGGGSAIVAADVATAYLPCPHTGTITGWTLICSPSGSIEIDVWKDTYANALPTVADTICGGNEPAVSSGVQNTDSTLTAWKGLQVTAGDVFGFKPNTSTTVEWAILVLNLTLPV